MQAWWWIVYGLAVARLTGLATVDVITEPIRRAVLVRLNEDRPGHVLVAYLLTCQWCASMWVAPLVIAPAYFAGHSAWLQIPAMCLAVSQVTGMTSTLGR